MQDRENFTRIIDNPTAPFTVKLTGTRVPDSYGTIQAEYSVTGYWGDALRVNFDRDSGEPEIRYSSGGYEDGVTNIQRARNFADAMADAADLAEGWQFHGFEAAWALHAAGALHAGNAEAK